MVGAYIRLVEASYVALPRFPKSQKAGHRPPVSTLPGSVAFISTMPPGHEGIIHHQGQARLSMRENVGVEKSNRTCDDIAILERTSR